MKFESAPSAHNKANVLRHHEDFDLDSDFENLEKGELRNEIYHEYMKQQLVENFIDAAYECDYEEEEVQELLAALGSLSTDQIMSALSLSFELLWVRLEKMLEQSHAKQSTLEEEIVTLVKQSAKYGYGVGYHTSPFDIHPQPDGSWLINGTEEDHRDNDLPMAYYSQQYRHLFRKKNPNFIYVVRSRDDDRTDGNWYRASSLSVIMRVPFKEVHDYVEHTAEDIERERKAPAAHQLRGHCL